jgi:hypothetical protein
MKKSLLVLISIGCLWLLNGCGGGSSTQTHDVVTHFSITSATPTPTAGLAFNITVTALDAAGQMVASYSGTVQFMSSSGQAVIPASGALVNGAGTFSVTLNKAGSQTITVTDAASHTGTSSALTVSAQVPTQFSVTPSTPTPTAGTPFSLTVSALDASNNVVSGYSGTVRLTSSDGQFVPPANAGLTNGTGTFQATLKTVFAQTITATDTVTPSITGSAALSVNAGPATHLTVSAPTSATAGLVFNFTVTPFDAYGNVANTYTGMVKFSSNDPQAALPANTPFANGPQGFSATLTKIQNTTTISAADITTSSIAGMSSAISVVSNAVTHLTIGSPGGAAARATFLFTISALDAANNVSVGYSGPVHFTSSDPQAVFATNPATLTSGKGQFKATLESPGSQSITATDAATTSLTISSGSITVTATAQLAITSSAPPDGTFGVNYGPTNIEYFRCDYRAPFGYDCRPCTGTTGCSSLPLCPRRGLLTPCVERRGTFVGFTLTATGGVPPYQWSATGVPSGLSVNSTNGEIIGTPTAPGTYAVAVTVADSGTPQVISPASNYTITIKDPPPPVINASPAPPNGAVNLTYGFTFTASSPAPPLTWRISVGTLPAGLALNPDGALTGTPTTTGTASITLIATDEFKQDSAPQVFNIQIFANGFVATGSMATARVAATATLLNTGKVLVAGGTDPSGKALASAELFDPATGSFSATGSMATARDNFAAALLPSGKVLVTGGLDSSGNPLASAEVYDPAAKTFSATTGVMTIARASHTATLLNTGKVLIAGWGNAIAELFDPSMGTFTQTGNMLEARTSHIATLLNDGRVLIAGGIGASQQMLAEAELYDPSSGSFSQTLGKLATARDWHAATLLKDGTVLLTGGLDNTGKAIATAELFTLSTQSFTATKGNMETPRAFQTATRLTDGSVLVSGGSDGTATIASAEVYDPTAGTFSPTGSMVSTRQSHTATLLIDGAVLVTGGTNGTVLATAELYK